MGIKFHHKLFGAMGLCFLMASAAMGQQTAQQSAQQSVMQQCGAQWQAAKTANTTNGQTWPQFLADCRKNLAGAPAVTSPAVAVAPPAPVVINSTTPAVAAPVAPSAPKPSVAPNVPAALPATASPATVPPATASPATVPPATAQPITANSAPSSAGRAQEQNRIKACGEQWKAYKASGQVQPGETWPKYWSACNKRLKAQGQ